MRWLGRWRFRFFQEQVGFSLLEVVVAVGILCGGMPKGEWRKHNGEYGRRTGWRQYYLVACAMAGCHV